MMLRFSMRREAEALDVAAPGRGHSTDVERLERRLAQQEKHFLDSIQRSKNSKS